MSVKVSTVVCTDPAPVAHLNFEWTCTKCGNVNEDEVVENTIFQYKKRNLGPMTIERNCVSCGSKHSMELRL